jgi:iron complex outermembrane receptor protein
MKMRMFFCIALIAVASITYAQSAGLTGKVTTSSSAPIPGVSVYVLNTNRGTVSDDQGNFSLNNLLPGKYTIQFSAIGFATTDREIVVDKTNASPVSIMLADASKQLDAVLVSAQKREEALQKVPISISALSSRQVKEYRLWNTDELTAIVPNLYSANSGDDRNVTSVRGITTTSYDQAVTTYIDGVNQFGLDTYISQLLDIERIEVLRGPQGTLYGRNAMGGVINIITRQPTNVTNGFAELNFGNYGQQRYSAGVRTPIVKNKIYAGAALMYNQRDGFYRNDFNNTRFDNQKTLTGNYYLKVMATEKWSFGLNVKHNENRNDAAFPMVNLYAADPFDPPFVVNQNATARMIDNTLNGSLTANYAGRVFNFSSQTAYQANHRYYNRPLDGDFSPIDGVTIINNYGHKWNNVQVWTQEFKLSSPAVSSSPVKWTAGTYLFHQNNPTKQSTHFGKDAAMVGAPDTDFGLISTQTGKNSGAALFGQITCAVNNRLDLIGGLRYDYENRKYEVLGEYQKDPDPNPVFETRPDTSARANFSAFSPKFGLSYDLTGQTKMFATYSRGYRTGGFTQLGADPSQPPLYSYKPEYSNNVELGIKNTLFNSRLRINAAIFYTTVTDAQVPTLVLPDAITVTRNAGKLTSKGGELELAATPARGLQVEYNFGYTNAEYKTLKLAQNGSVVDLDGKKQIFTPEITSMLALQYGYDLGTSQHLKLVARGEWMYLGKQYFDLANSISQKAYSLLNTRFGITSRHFDLMFWGRNLGDKKYIAYAYDFGAVHLGNPKTYGVTLTANF